MTVATVIVVLTLVVSPAEGGSLSQLLPAALSFAGSVSASDSCVGGIPCQDGHALAFLVLALFASVHVAVTWAPRERFRRLVSLLVLLVAFAAGDEFAQGWAGRDPSFADWFADSIGITVGVIVGPQLTRVLVRG